MGNKVNPIGMRLQVNRTWDSRWYADTKDYGDLLLEDLKIREFIKKECHQAGVARVIIERPHKKCRVTIHTARPGVIIGKKGADIEGLRKKLASLTDSELHLNIVEVRKPELDAALVGESIAQQLERRVSFRRAMKRAVQNAKIEEEIAQLNIDDLKRNLSSQLKITLENYNNQLELVKLTERLIASSEKNLKIADERFKGSLITSFDYRSVQLNYINASQSRLNAIYNLKNTEIILIRLIGGLVR